MPDEKTQAPKAPPETGQKQEPETGPVGVIRIITHTNQIPGPGEGMLRFGYLIDVPVADSEMLSVFGKLMTELGIEPDAVIPLPSDSADIARKLFDNIATGTNVDNKDATAGKTIASSRTNIRTVLKRELAIWPDLRKCVSCKGVIDSCLLNFGERNSFNGVWFVRTGDDNVVMQIGYFVSNVAESGIMIARVYDYNVEQEDGTIIRRSIAVNVDDIIDDKYNLFCTPHQIVEAIEDGAYLFSDEVDESDEND